MIPFVLSLLLASGLSLAACPPVRIQASPIKYLTVDKPTRVMVLDERGEGEDVFWLAPGETVQASIHVITQEWRDDAWRAQDWLYVHKNGESGWVKFDYQTMRISFDYGNST